MTDRIEEADTAATGASTYAHAGEVAGAGTVPGALHVLVVDDNEDSALSLAMLLELQGYAVTTAFRGDEALARAREQPPDVALLDIGLPDVSGYELAGHLRATLAPRGVVLVALTGWGQEEDRRSALAAGFDRHFTKPVDPDALERMLREVGAR